MHTKVSKKPFPWTMLIVATIFTLIISLMVARCNYDNEDATFGELLNLLPGFIAENPIDFIYIGSTKWTYAWWLWVAWFAGIVYIYVDYEKNKNSYYGKEKGTADWNDWKKYTERYAYPKGKKGHHEPPEGSNDLGNLILSKDTFLNLNINETFKNDNVFVLGMTGTGKTRYYVKPNVLQQNTSYIITDPSGELLTDVGLSLMKAGYVIKLFNLFDMEHSCGYNPFEYINSDSDIPILVDCLVKNTNDAKAGKGDQFFDQAMVQLFTALFYFIYYREPKENQNMGRVCEMLTMMKVDENKPDAKSKLDLMFDKYEKEEPNATAVTNYKMFRIGAGKTLKSIIISANVRMRPFTLDAVRNLTAKDTIHLDEIGDHKQALFIVTPTQIKTYNFLAAMMYTQLFMIMFNKGSEICKNRYMLKWDASSPIQSKVYTNAREKKDVEAAFKARVENYRRARVVEEEREGLSEEDIGKVGKYRYAIKDPDGKTLTFGTEDGQPAIFECKEQADYFMRCIKNGKISHGNIRLPSHVHLVLDEFANIGLIPEFDQIIATMRKFSISCTLILQSRAQLKELYKDNADTLISNCATLLFLGSTSSDDAKWLSERLGKKTQAVRNSSYSYGAKGSSSQSWNKDGIDLLTLDEVLKKPSEDCVVQIEGLAPFYDKKYPLQKHPNYGQLADADSSLVFPYKSYFAVGVAARKQKEQETADKESLVTPGTPEERAKAEERVGRVRNRAVILPSGRPDHRAVQPGDTLLSQLFAAQNSPAEPEEPGSMAGFSGNNAIPQDAVIRRSINKFGSTAGAQFANPGIKPGSVMNMDPDGYPF